MPRLQVGGTIYHIALSYTDLCIRLDAKPRWVELPILDEQVGSVKKVETARFNLEKIEAVLP
jgi:hypothetical protein